MLENIQKKIGVTPDGAFGRITAKAMQKELGLGANHAAHFLGQCHHESGGFKRFVENLNYSAAGLRKTWPSRFDDVQAKYYANNQEAIANKVYADRMGNGNEESGDGWKHRGMGLIQLTGKNNQSKFATHIGDLRINNNPLLIATDYALESAMYFFDSNNIWRWCDVVNEDSVLNVSRIINIGNVKSRIVPNGLQDRINQTFKIYEWLK